MAQLQKIRFKDYYRPQEYVEKPKYTATWQKLAEKRIMTRVRGGLDPGNSEINQAKLGDPGLEWVNDPPVPSKSLLVEKRRKEGLRDQQKFEKNFETHTDGQGRIQNRENCILRLTFKGLDTVSMNKQVLKEKRTKDMIEDMTKKFGNQVLGVHGQELPKFAGHPRDQFYWTMQKSFNKSPTCQSLNRLQQEQKYWAVNDAVKLADTTGEEAPVDPFKSHRRPAGRTFSQFLSKKVTEDTPWRYSNKLNPAHTSICEPTLQKGWKPNIKWSEMEKNYKCQGHDRPFRTFDKIIDHAQSYDKLDKLREIKMEELVIKQAPRSLQVDVARLIQAEKSFEASKKIGAGRSMQSKGTKFQAGTHQLGGDSLQNQGDQDKDPASGTGVFGVIKSPTKEGTAPSKDVGAENLGLNTFNSTAKGSLLQRMQSPSVPLEKGSNQTGSLNMASTMAATQRIGSLHSGGSSMDATRTDFGRMGQMNMTVSSPFRDTVARGIVTGTKMMGK